MKVARQVTGGSLARDYSPGETAEALHFLSRRYRTLVFGMPRPAMEVAGYSHPAPDEREVKPSMEVLV